MFKLNKLNLIIISFFLISCSSEIQKKSVLKEKSLDLQVLEVYTEGVKELEGGYALLAAKKFNEVEILFPQSQWAPKSSLMAAYAYFSKNYYDDAIAELTRFLRVYPLDSRLDYAYYLLAMSYYQKIVDEKKDLQSIVNAKENFLILKKKYPNSEYALDAEFKLGLINDVLASKEMYIGRYYVEKKKWIPAINRFRNVIDDYETTIYTEEALHRLVEIYYILGLQEESQKYANTLGYNYQSSEWYEKSYLIFNKNYTKKKIKKEKTTSLTDKIKSFLKLND
tara:strand:+ start:422 stop:1264 length:843 start_codon:yes stop_codon:yes gene_type:complete